MVPRKQDLPPHSTVSPGQDGISPEHHYCFAARGCDCTSCHTSCNDIDCVSSFSILPPTCFLHKDSRCSHSSGPFCSTTASFSVELESCTYLMTPQASIFSLFCCPTQSKPRSAIYNQGSHSLYPQTQLRRPTRGKFFNATITVNRIGLITLPYNVQQGVETLSIGGVAYIQKNKPSHPLLQEETYPLCGPCVRNDNNPFCKTLSLPFSIIDILFGMKRRRIQSLLSHLLHSCWGHVARI